MELFLETFAQFAAILLMMMGTAIALALVGLVLMYRSLRDIRVPPGTDFFTTMHYVPLTLVVLLDLLDFGLDILSAPIAWIILDRMGLSSLRNTAALQAVVPLTGPIPALTIAWLLARLLGLGHTPYERAELYDPYDDDPYDEPYRQPGRRRNSSIHVIDVDQ